MMCICVALYCNLQPTCLFHSKASADSLRFLFVSHFYSSIKMTSLLRSNLDKQSSAFSSSRLTSVSSLFNLSSEIGFSRHFFVKLNFRQFFSFFFAPECSDQQIKIKNMLVAKKIKLYLTKK